jgi:hypothetical protein
MQQGIKIAMIWKDLHEVDEFSEFILRVSNGSCSAYQQFYLRRDGFKDFANGLAARSMSITAVH